MSVLKSGASSDTRCPLPRMARAISLSKMALKHSRPLLATITSPANARALWKVCRYGDFDCMITCNERLLVRLEGDTGAWKRRLMLLEFKKRSLKKVGSPIIPKFFLMRKLQEFSDPPSPERSLISLSLKIKATLRDGRTKSSRRSSAL